MTKKLALRISLFTMYPLLLLPIMAILSLFCGAGYLMGILATGLCLALFWLGGIFYVLANRVTQKKPWRTRAIAVCFAVGFGLSSYYCKIFFDPAGDLLFGIIAAVAFLAGGKVFFKPLETLTSSFAFTTICLWFLGAGLAWQFLDPRVPALLMVAFLAGFAFLFMMCHNQIALEQTLHDRDGEQWELPQEIRKSNNRMLLLYSVIGGLALLLFRPVGAALRIFVQWAYTGILYLMGIISEMTGSAADGVISRDTTRMILRGQPSAIIAWIVRGVEIAFVCFVVYLIIHNRRAILDKIADFWIRLRRWIVARLKNPTAKMPESTGFVDYVEDITLDPGTNIQAVRESLSHGRWRKQYRRFLRMTDKIGRYRFGYGLMLARLPESFAKPADSPLEILQNLPPQMQKDVRWHSVTKAYIVVRYGGGEPLDEAIRGMEELLREMK